MTDNSLDDPLRRLNQNNILRADHHIHGTVAAKARIYAGKAGSKNVYQLIFNHCSWDNIAFPDEIRHKRVFRLIVDRLRTSDLLNIALIHNHDGVRHGKRFFLVMGDVDKSNAKFVFHADQLILHFLPQF